MNLKNNVVQTRDIMIIKRTNIKEHIKDFKISKDFAETLSKKTELLIKEAVNRAKENNRRTVMSKDL